MKVLLATQKPFSAEAVEGIAQIVKAGGHSFATLEKYEGEKELARRICHWLDGQRYAHD